MSALKLSTEARTVVLPRVNLLPPEIEEARRFRRVQGGLAGGVLASFVVVGLLYAGAVGSVSDANAQVDSASQDQRTLQSSAARYKDVTATYTRAADAQVLLTQAMGQEVRYSAFLDQLTRTVPEGVWLKSLTFAQSAPAAAAATGVVPGTPAAAAVAGIGTLSVSGVAFRHEDVAAWLDAQALQAGYDAPLLTTSQEVLLGARTVTEWSGTLTLSTKALSGRYAKTGS